MPAKPRRERQLPRVFCKKWLHNIISFKEECFVPLSDFNKLRKRYYRLFRWYQEAKNMNYITNDFGIKVPAVGAPGSIARMRVQYPDLISRLNSKYWGTFGIEGLLPYSWVDAMVGLEELEQIVSKGKRQAIIACTDIPNPWRNP